VLYAKLKRFTRLSLTLPTLKSRPTKKNLRLQAYTFSVGPIIKKVRIYHKVYLHLSLTNLSIFFVMIFVMIFADTPTLFS